MQKRSSLLTLLFFVCWSMFAAPAFAQPSDAPSLDWSDRLDEIPEPWRAWIPWATRSLPMWQCIPDASGPVCSWPTSLQLEWTDAGLRFELTGSNTIPSVVRLPSLAGSWPAQVELERAGSVSRPAVMAQAEQPVIHVDAGRFVVRGVVPLLAPAESILVDPATAMVVEVEQGVRRIRRIEGNGTIPLRREAAEREQDRVALEVFRLLSDGVPMTLQTIVRLRVSGQPRELDLGGVIPAGFIPHQIDSALPAEWSEDGQLLLQLRAGTWEVSLNAHTLEDVTSFQGTWNAADWPAIEYWSFVSSSVRSVQLSGPPSVDPARTDIPSDWRSFPTWMMGSETTLQLQELRRGESSPPPDQVQVARTFWVDEQGLTATDYLTGRLSQGGRINVLGQGELGRAQVDGIGRVITTDGSDPVSGVELRILDLNLATDLQYPSLSEIPAVGYNRDASNLSATLNYSPGWTIWSVDGPDDVYGTWFKSWTLLDLFVLVLLVLAIRQYAGNLTAAVALVALGLSWHETGAVRYLWFTVVVLGLLTRHLPVGHLRVWSYRAGGAVLAWAVLLAVVFAGTQARNAFFPQLANPWAASSSWPMRSGMMDVPASAPPAAMDEDHFEAEQEEANEPTPTDQFQDEVSAAEVAQQVYRQSRGRNDEGRGAGLYGGSLDGSISDTLTRAQSNEVDPAEVVQTGPGIPTWSWKSVQLSWNGPVGQDATIRVHATGPFGTGLIQLLRGLAMLALALLCVRLRPAKPPAPPAPAAPAAAPEPAPAVTIITDPADLPTEPSAVALEPGTPPAPAIPSALLALVAGALLLMATLSPAPALAQDASPPTDTQLQQIRDILTAQPACGALCLSFHQLQIRAVGSSIEMIATLHVQAPSIWTLPGPVSSWTPSLVDLEGVEFEHMRRIGDHLALFVPAGIHTVRLQGASTESLSLAFGALTPRLLQFEGDGWTLEGYTPGVPIRNSVQLVRQMVDDGSGAGDGDSAPSDPANALPPWVRLERTLRIGLNWRVDTVATNLRAGSSVLLRVPLLDGEQVTTPGIEVEEGAALVQLGADDGPRMFESSLEPRDVISLTAASGRPWTEIWRLDCSSIWQCSYTGLAPVQLASGSAWLPMWQPWAGESVELRFYRPVPAAGEQVTVDRVNLAVQGGRELRDVTLNSTWRTSNGGEQSITIDAAAVVQSFSVDGRSMPLNPEQGVLRFTLEPGSHEVVLQWRERVPTGLVDSTPQVALSAAAVNVTIEHTPSRRRWILWTDGPAWGPVVTMWQYVIGLLLASLLLARFIPVPMAAPSWFVLGIGTTQTDGAGLLMVVLWLALLGWRGRQTELKPGWSNLLVILIAGMTFIAFLSLTAAIASGLALHPPDMGIRGGASSDGYLVWYEARSAADLPRGWALTVPLWVWHVLMLVWSLWVARMFIRWARWGWAQMQQGGFWRRG